MFCWTQKATITAELCRIVQNQDGIVHLKAERIEALTVSAAQMASHDFHCAVIQSQPMNFQTIRPELFPGSLAFSSLGV